MSKTPKTDKLDRELHAKGVLADRYSDMLELSRKLERYLREVHEASSGDWGTWMRERSSDWMDEVSGLFSKENAGRDRPRSG